MAFSFMKSRVIETLSDVETLSASIRAAASATQQVLTDVSEKSPMSALWFLKFQPSGYDPIDSTSRLNVIEQLNQSFTYEATIRSLRVLFKRHPEEAPFRINLGTAAGSDIESEYGTSVAAEVFAAVRPQNNRKLAKDLRKVAGTTATHKYVFFIAPGYEARRYPELETVPGVEVWALGGENCP